MTTAVAAKSARERSRNGCLTCRQKRKKCDETKPHCTRCVQTDDHCIWPARSTKNKPTPAKSTPPVNSTPHHHGSSSSEITPPMPMSENLDELKFTYDPYFDVPASQQNMGYGSTDMDLLMGSLSYLAGENPPTAASNLDASRHLTYTHYDLDILPDPINTQPPQPGPSQRTLSQKLDSMLAYNYRDMDEDEEEGLDTKEWFPRAQKALEILTRHQDHLHFLKTRDSYILFATRYSFDPAKAFHSIVLSVEQRTIASESTRYGMLSVAALFRSYNDPSIPPPVLRKCAEELVVIAGKMVQLDVQRPDVPPVMKLAGVSELACYYYFSGNLVEYYKYLEQAISVAKSMLGPNKLDFHVLRGDDTVDIRILAWCDILSAVALSQPTRLSYHFNLEKLLRDNLEGRETDNGDAGLEWMIGCPDAFTMLMVEIITLAHSLVSQTDRFARARAIEGAVRAWKVRPSDVKNSVLRMRRISAQEIWRHCVILYLHKAIYQATASSEVVRKSVKQVRDLASIIPTGHNPDCLLGVPYFIAATFSVSPKDRHFFRTRLLKCGNEGYLRVLVVRLDDLWKEADATGRFVDWATKQPPNVMF